MPLSQIVSASIEDGAVAPVDLSSVAQYTGFKNRIINGRMEIDQRNAGASVTPASGAVTFVVDRMQTYVTQASKLTAQRNAGSVTPPTGFINYLGFTSSSAYSVISSDLFLAGQSIEGVNCTDLAWGTANAATVTLSFWVRSSLTGTFGGSLTNQAQNRSYVYSFVINSANTWEQKSITIAGDTSGTWTTDTNVGIRLYINLGSGSSSVGASGSWAAGLLTAPTGAVNIVGTSGATFYITGLQLEKGTTATSFDVRPYGTELQLCQRYYQVVGHVLISATAGIYTTVAFMQPMWVAPSIGPVTFDAGTGATFNNMNVSTGAALTKAYQNTNHNQTAQANIPLSAEL